MAVHVVTIAMTTGARADQVGRLVAEHLGFQYISDEIIGRAAQHAGVSPRDVAEVEHSQSLIRRIITATGLVALPELGMSPLPLEVIDPSASYRRLIPEVIREVAGQGRVVILAHGAGILLAGAPGVLRVLVTASALPHEPTGSSPNPPRTSATQRASSSARTASAAASSSASSIWMKSCPPITISSPTRTCSPPRRSRV